METINQAVEKALPNGQRGLPEKVTSERTPETLPVRDKAMRRFWQRMAAIYGHRWTSAYGERCDDDSGDLTVPGDTWQRGLDAVGEHRIATGLNACVMSPDPWPPTLPKFRAMCLDIPSLARVRLTFNGASETTPFTRKMWQNIDSFRLKQADTEKADRILRDAYEMTCEYVMTGAELPTPSAAAIAREPLQTVPEKPREPVDVEAVIIDLAEKIGVRL